MGPARIESLGDLKFTAGRRRAGRKPELNSRRIEPSKLLGPVPPNAQVNPGLVSQLSNAAQHSQAEASPITASGLVRSTLRLAWHASVAAQIMVDLLTEDDRSGSRSAEHSWLKRQSVLEAICLASGIRATADSWRIMIPPARRPAKSAPETALLPGNNGKALGSSCSRVSGGG